MKCIFSILVLIFVGFSTDIMAAKKCQVLIPSVTQAQSHFSDILSIINVSDDDIDTEQLVSNSGVEVDLSQPTFKSYFYQTIAIRKSEKKAKLLTSFLIDLPPPTAY